jgi:hypothetical protein
VRRFLLLGFHAGLAEQVAQCAAAAFLFAQDFADFIARGAVGEARLLVLVLPFILALAFDEELRVVGLAWLGLGRSAAFAAGTTRAAAPATSGASALLSGTTGAAWTPGTSVAARTALEAAALSRAAGWRYA